MATSENKKYEALVEAIDDKGGEWAVRKVFVWTSAKEVQSKYSHKYIFIKSPEEIVEDNGSQLKGSISQRDLLWVFEWFASFKWLSMDKLTDILYKKAKKQSIKILLSQIKNKIKEGWRISQVLANKQYTRVIPTYMIELIKIGESSAKEDETYKIIVEKLRMQQKIRSKTIGAMIYPIVVVSIAVILIVILLVVLVPRFTEIFKWKEKYLPALTKSVMDTSAWLQNNVVFFFAGIAIFFFAAIFLIRNSYTVRKLWYKLIMNLPVIWWVVRMNTEILILQLFYFWEFAVSNASGNFNYVKLMQMIYDWLENPIYKEQFAIVPSKIEEWLKIWTVLEDNVPDLSFDVISYIQFWEESNSLAEKVEYLYKKYTEDLLNFYEGISKIIEPLLIIFLGAAIWYIVWWIMLWVMNLANTIR